MTRQWVVLRVVLREMLLVTIRSLLLDLLGQICNREFVRRNCNRLNRDGAIGSFTRDSNLCSKRAKAADPILTSVMTAHFLKFYAELYEAGELATPLPNTDQVNNGDEIGFDPNGKFSRTLHYCPEGKPPPRSFRLHKGERAPFWATMFYWSKATGAHPCLPVIVHQGEEGDTIRADYLDGLSKDWVVHATPSWYMDQKGFALVCHSLVQHCQARMGYHKLLYVDGHEIHWCSQCLRFLRDRHIYLMFLKAHDSTNDQPNNMGNNAQVQCQYKWAVNEWMHRYTGVMELLSVPYFNRIRLDEVSHGFSHSRYNPAGLRRIGSPSDD
jgi:hypothetical protein